MTPASILLVGLEELHRHRITEAFRGERYAIVEAPDTRAALHYLMSENLEHPRLIILGIENQEASGDEFLGVIKNYYRLSKIPVVTLAREGFRDFRDTTTVVRLEDVDDESVCNMVRELLRE